METKYKVVKSRHPQACRYCPLYVNGVYTCLTINKQLFEDLGRTVNKEVVCEYYNIVKENR